MIVRLTLPEVFLLETIAWLLLWLLSDYVAALLTLILGAIVLAVLIFALIAELLERSKVPRQYFWIMGISVLAPIVSALLYLLIFGGRLSFLEQI